MSVSDIYDGVGVADPYPLLAELRHETPVMEGDILARFDVPSQADYANSGRPVYTVFRYEDVMKVLRDPENWHSRSEEHTSELQSLMRISYAVFCLKKKKYKI